MARLSVRVHPGAAKERIDWREDGSLEVHLRKRPVDGEANRALVEVLAATFGVPKRDVLLVRGHRARTKIVELPLSSEEARARLTG